MAGWNRNIVYLLALVVALASVLTGVPAHAEDESPVLPDPAQYVPPFRVIVPLEGSRSLYDSFGAIRDGGIRLHLGNDISAPHMTPVLAAADGMVSKIGVGHQPGLYVEVRHAGGWTTRYLYNDPHGTEAPRQPYEIPVPDSAVPYVVGTWWDVMMIPPHGYVKFKTWINVPWQTDDDTSVAENTNNIASWVFHCHILRHEDRGMMMIVKTKPKPEGEAGN
jgi:hypothetical protein